MFDKLRRDFEAKFKAITPVACPAFGNEAVVFNGKGLNHLFYKGDRSPRTLGDIEGRLIIFPFVAELLEMAHHFSGYDEVDKNGQLFKYWEFIGVIKQRRIKVVIRQKGAKGNKHFWSVIPCWKTKKSGLRTSGSRLDRD